VTPFEHPSVRRLVELALDEEFGRGVATSVATIAPSMRAVGLVVAREPLVFAGGPILGVIVEASRRRSVGIDIRCADGLAVGSDTVVAEMRGPATDLLAIERVVLNFLQRMSGIATQTRRYVEAIAGTRAKIVDTRKTIPGWRMLDKYAVVAGGGTNHRFGLDDGVLIKDNHIVACGGVRQAIERARAKAHHLLAIEIECDTLAQVDEALTAGARAILLDNMSPADLMSAVRHIGGRAVTEASGGVTLDTVRAIAESGVDLVSVGALTHSARAVDLALDLTVD
jgi:nicotinate-nucleotide pyrophosphorylase (carboxylating)